eukprot:TRINITY_DN1906_c0_g2_i4.p2 TRINITY_DN1906_c0_g2~~TRINITY_DN1906_c0_g2_i4.p2  ORF type:complete len:140 (-),score=22.69 TRINITY_DN1906_c0_g2_i4:632-1051(-)
MYSLHLATFLSSSLKRRRDTMTTAANEDLSLQFSEDRFLTVEQSKKQPFDLYSKEELSVDLPGKKLGDKSLFLSTKRFNSDDTIPTIARRSSKKHCAAHNEPDFPCHPKPRSQSNIPEASSKGTNAHSNRTHVTFPISQ